MDGGRARVGAGTGGNGSVETAHVAMGTWRWHAWEWEWVGMGTRGAARWVRGTVGAPTVGFSAPMGCCCGFGALGVPGLCQLWGSPRLGTEVVAQCGARGTCGCWERSLGCPDVLWSAAQLDAFGGTRRLGDGRGTRGRWEIRFGVRGRLTVG